MTEKGTKKDELKNRLQLDIQPLQANKLPIGQLYGLLCPNCGTATAIVEGMETDEEWDQEGEGLESSDEIYSQPWSDTRFDDNE